MDLTGYGVIKLVDRKTILDEKTKKESQLWKFYIQSDDGSSFFLWSQTDWSQFLDVPASFVLKIGNKNNGYFVRIVDIFPKDTGKSKK